MKMHFLLEEKFRDPLALPRLSQFRYLQIKKGESIQNINEEREFLVCMVVQGTVCFTKKEAGSNPVMAIRDEMFFICSLEECSIKAIGDSRIIIHACNIVAPYLHSRILAYLHDVNMKTITPIDVLSIPPLMRSFLSLLVDYIKEGSEVPDLHRAKEYELFVLFKICYSKTEIASFFSNALTKKLQFFTSVMMHYKVCRTSRELAARCNLNEHLFSRLFKECFLETPYKWLQKQTANEIKMKLQEQDIPIKQILIEYNFKTFAHFTTFCRRNMGASPREIRKMREGDIKSELVNMY